MGEPTIREAIHPDLSLSRIPDVSGYEGYELSFDLAPRSGHATTLELRTLCRGTMLIGRLATSMGWSWTMTRRHIDRLSAPSGDFLLLSVSEETLFSPRFRRILADAVPACGLDPYKVKVMSVRKANVYILGHGLPPV